MEIQVTIEWTEQAQWALGLALGIPDTASAELCQAWMKKRIEDGIADLVAEMDDFDPENPYPDDTDDEAFFDDPERD